MADIYQHDQEESESLISKYLGSDSEESSEDASRATPEEQAHQIINKNVEAIAEALDVGKWDIIYGSFSLLCDSFHKYRKILRGDMPRNWLLAMHRVLETFKECRQTEKSSVEKSSRKHFNALKAFLDSEKNQTVIDYVHKEYDLFQKKQLEDVTGSLLGDVAAPTVQVKRDDGLNVPRILSFFRISFRPEDEDVSAQQEEKEERQVAGAAAGTAAGAGSLLSRQDIFKPAVANCKKHAFPALHTLLLRSDSVTCILHFYIYYIEQLAARGDTGYMTDLLACLRSIVAVLERNIEDDLLSKSYDSGAAETNLSTAFGLRLLTAIANITNIYEAKNVVFYVFLAIFIAYYSEDGKLRASPARLISTLARNLLRDSCSVTWRYGEVNATAVAATEPEATGLVDPLTLVPTCSSDVKASPYTSELLKADFAAAFPDAVKVFRSYFCGHVFFRSKYLYLLYRTGSTLSHADASSTEGVEIPHMTEEATRKAPRAGVFFPFTKKAIEEDKSLSDGGDDYDTLIALRHDQLSYLRLAFACAIDTEFSMCAYELFMTEQEHTIDEIKKLYDGRRSTEVKMLTLKHTDIDYMIRRLHYCIGIKAFASGRMHQAMVHLLLISNFAKGERSSTAPFLPATHIFEAEGALTWFDSDLIDAACLVSTLCSKFALLHNRTHSTTHQHMAPLQKTILQRILQLIDAGYQTSLLPHEFAIATAFKHLANNNQSGAVNAIVSCATWRYLRHYNSHYEKNLEDAIKILSLKFWVLNYQSVVAAIPLATLAKMHDIAEDKIERSLEGIQNIQVSSGVVTFLG